MIFFTWHPLVPAMTTLWSLNSFAMRRWFAILLLVCLPLQFSWAAVASYCGHGTEASVDHFGHHDHEGHGHSIRDLDADQKVQPDGAAADVSVSDCGHCHGYCAGMLEMAYGFIAQVHSNAPPALGAAPRAERVVAPPERPQWAPLA
jgi:hypothetical protein